MIERVVKTDGSEEKQEATEVEFYFAKDEHKDNYQEARRILDFGEHYEQCYECGEAANMVFLHCKPVVSADDVIRAYNAFSTTHPLDNY